jgi:predicted amidohydrolase
MSSRSCISWQTQTVRCTGEMMDVRAAIRALENGVSVSMANRMGTELGWRSLGYSCVASLRGAFLARLVAQAGVETARVVLGSPDLATWCGLATYLADRSPDVHHPYLG